MTQPTIDRLASNAAVSEELPQRSAGTVLIKRCVQRAFGVWVVPRRVWLWMMQKVFGRQAFCHASESIARVAGVYGVYLRQAFYRATLRSCGQDVYFGWSSLFSMREATVGDRVYIGRFCSIGYGEIADHVMLADGVQILSGGREHGPAEGQDSMHDQAQTFHPVRIGRGAWLGAGAIVMADVGRGSIIGAGAVVTRPVPANSVAVGVPAEVVKTMTCSADRGECPVGGDG